MPPAHAPIPLPGRANTGLPRAAFNPAFSAPERWAILVLAWLAFGVAGYLAIHSVSGTSVAGCGVGGGNGCDVVLSSSWSKWLGIPVAVLGLAVYAALASLSPLMWWRNEEASRWITTGIVLLSVVAAGASAWFIGVQVFAIQAYCKFCLVTDTCGILLGAIASIAAVRSVAKCGRGSGGTTGVHALRSAMPVAARPTAASTFSTTADPPALGLAFGGAVPLLALLVAGQMLFAGKTYEVQKVALTDTIDLTGAPSGKSGEEQSLTDSGSESKSDETAVGRVNNSTETKNDLAKEAIAGDGKDVAADSAATAKDEAPSLPEEPAKERIVKFLGGTLALDVYKHPLIGSPEAPHVAIEMVSYDCPHCRRMAAKMNEALARYGDQVALIILPIPLDVDCNKLMQDKKDPFAMGTGTHNQGACTTSRLVCGIAKLNQPVLSKFHEFLMSRPEKRKSSGDDQDKGEDKDKDKPPAMNRVLPKAYGLVNGEKLRAFTNSAEAKKQVDGYIDLFGKLQAQSKSKTFGLPVQILGDKIVTGEVEKIDDVFKAWEENLGVTPK